MKNCIKVNNINKEVDINERYGHASGKVRVSSAYMEMYPVKPTSHILDLG